MITKKEQEANELKHFNKAAGKLSAVALSAGALALSCPTYAFASQEGGIQAILPEMSEFIPMLVAFIILWIVLAKFGWPVFDKMLEKRANSIRDDLKNAEEARQESERVLAEYQQQLAEAKVQASKIVADAKKAGEDREGRHHRQGAGRSRRHDREGPCGHRGREEGRYRRPSGFCRRPLD